MRSSLPARVLALAITVLAAHTVFAQQLPVRMNWQTFRQDPARVQSFRNGVAAMKARNTAPTSSAEYRTSWNYWASMHGYFGTGSPFGTVEADLARYKALVAQGQADPGLEGNFTGVMNTMPPDAIAQQVWGQCQHGTDWFFAWHRFYLYYFEQVLQQAANDPNLRLPYWDYTDPAQVAMPPEYTSPTYVNAQGQTVDNPLYEPRRFPGWNVPTTNTLDPTSTDINDQLSDTTFFDVTTQGDGFQNGIEYNVHGYVHCTVIDCPVTDMGAVGYSANDPIFWSHHANIDRMWDCWTSLGNTNPTDSAYVNKSFSYIDVNGNLVTNQVADLSNGKITLGYVYQQASNCARPTAAPQAAPQPAPPPAMTDDALQSARQRMAAPVVLGNVKKHVINAAITRKRVPIAGGASMNTPRMLALRGTDALPVRTDLVLRDIQFDTHPGTQFNVFLERRGDRSKRVKVGVLSFFMSMNPMEHDHDDKPVTRVFDVTNELRQLAGANANLKDVDVVFEATGGRMGQTRKFTPKPKLTVGEIELRVTAMR